ncbi:MAG: hypothetical protein ACLFST_09350 [Spirochaetia bacterium]
MNRKMMLLLTAFLVLAAGCSEKDEPLETIPEEAGPVAEEQGPIVRDAKPSMETGKMVPAALDFSPNTTKDELVRLRGKPEDIRTEKVENFHDEEVIDTRETYVYYGYSYMFYYSAQKEETSLVLLRIDEPVFEMNRGITIGSALDEVTDAFGEPNMIVEDSVVYFTPEKVIEYVIESGTVTKILISINTL